MTRGIVIVGNESPLASAVAAEAARRVQLVGTALIANRFGPDSEKPKEAALPVEGSAQVRFPWLPASPISSRTLVTAAKNRLQRIDEVLLVCSPAALRKRADELSPEVVDTLVDDQIKGWFFLVRELALLFRAQQSGTLALVLSEVAGGGGKDDRVDLFGPTAAAAFRALAQGLLASSFTEPYRTLGFSSAEAGEDDAFAAFIFKTLDEGAKRDAGKWHKYGKMGIFGH